MLTKVRPVLLITAFRILVKEANLRLLCPNQDFVISIDRDNLIDLCVKTTQKHNLGLKYARRKKRHLSRFDAECEM